MNAKRAQTSVFIIIGLVILISFALIISLQRGDSPDRQPETEESELEVYVSQCLYETSEGALQTVGMQAGYTDLPEVNTEDYSIDSPYLSMQGLTLPYWEYEEHEGIPASEMPPLYKENEGDYSIQSQLEEYIEENLDNCINGFRAFESQNVKVQEKDSPEATVDFTDEEVLVDLEYPLEINKNKSIARQELFKAELPVRLKKVYNLAKDITEAEREGAFLEERLIDLIGAYSRIDGDYLPPMYGGVQITSCSEREFWVAEEVKKDFKQMITGNIPYIQVENANNRNYQVDRDEFEDEEDAEVAQGVYNRLSTTVSDSTYPSISADFNYMSSFPMELDFGGRGFLEPNSFEMNLLVGNYCLFEYKFFYNTKFPVLVTLYDEESDIDDNGYMFQFPLMLVLKDNHPKVKMGEEPEEPEPGVRDYQCAMEQRVSEEVSINVTDDRGEPVEDAYVTYQCGPSRLYDRDENGSIVNVSSVSNKCFIGKTNENGIMEEKFPPCPSSGVMEVKAQDHLGMVERTGPIEEGVEYNASFTLQRAVEREVVVDKYFVEPPVPEGLSVEDSDPSIVEEDGEITECSLSGDTLPLKGVEKTMIRLKKLDEENGVLDVDPFAMYSTSNNATIKLGPGRYRADIMLIREEQYPGEMTIKKNSQVRSADEGGLSSGDKMYYPEEDVEIPTVNSGGAVYEFEIGAEELYNNEKIRFHVIDEGKPKFVENVGRALNDREACSQLNPEKIRPEMEE